MKSNEMKWLVISCTHRVNKRLMMTFPGVKSHLSLFSFHSHTSQIRIDHRKFQLNWAHSKHMEAIHCSNHVVYRHSSTIGHFRSSTGIVCKHEISTTFENPFRTSHPYLEHTRSRAIRVRLVELTCKTSIIPVSIINRIPFFVPSNRRRWLIPCKLVLRFDSTSIDCLCSAKRISLVILETPIGLRRDLSLIMIP